MLFLTINKDTDCIVDTLSITHDMFVTDDHLLAVRITERVNDLYHDLADLAAPEKVQVQTLIDICPWFESALDRSIANETQ